MLGSQQIVRTQTGCRMRLSVDWGCPQGGVLSLLLWSLVVDGLLTWPNREGQHTQFYTDDLALFITVKSSSTVSELMQRVLNILQSWCRAEELSVNPDKTELVLFTKRKKVDGLIEPVLLNGVIYPT
jgi:hypothetical protein